MKKLLLLICFLLPVIALHAQDKNTIIQQRVEFIAEQFENEEIDLTNLFDELNFFYEHPLNLNSATYEELEELNLLTDVQINNLLNHIDRFGKLISIYELQSLKYWDLATIELVLPFVRVDDRLDQLHVSLKEALRQGKFEAYLRFQTFAENKKGYDPVPDSILANSNSYYYGNSHRYYTRLRYSYRTNLSIGLTAEKDPGEQFFGSTQPKGFDFYSAHAFYKGGKYLKSVAIGDFQTQIGQGLNLWSGYAFQKTADPTLVKKSANPLRPYTSVDENRFLRGVGVEFGLGNFSLTNFASIKNADATLIVDSLLEEQEFVSSINLTGFHRTNSELDRKNALQERIIGSNLRYDLRNLHIGAAAVYQGYDRVYSKTLYPYNQFDFRGKQTLSTSVDYNYVFRNFNFFGEVSRVSHNGSWAQLHGLLLALDSRVTMSVVYRNYQKGYQTFYNAGFSEGSNTQNERGLFFGWKIKMNNAWTLNTYMDYFSFPWLKYLVDSPTHGHEFLIQPVYRPNRSLEIYGRYREQLRQRNSRDPDGTVTQTENVYQRNYRLNFNYAITESITLKSRIEYVTINRKSNRPESGLLMTQDILFRPKSSAFDVAVRYAVFQTDSYDSRIYSFENNALYVFSIPAYYYQGSRMYALIRYTFLRRFDLWARYGTTIYINQSSIGSGAEQLEGNVKTDITLQLRMKL